MGNISTKTLDLTFNALKLLDELKRNCKDLRLKISAILSKYDLANDAGFINCDDLFNLIQENSSQPDQFLKHHLGMKKVAFLIVQFLVLDQRPKQFYSEITTLSQLKEYVKADSLLNLFFNDWDGISKIVIYQDHFNIYSWNKYALVTEGEWYDIHVLDESIAFCQVELNPLLVYLTKSAGAHPNDMAIPRLGSNMKIAIDLNTDLRTEVASNMSKLITDQALTVFLPYFFCGLVQNAEDFDRWLDFITSQHYDDVYSVYHAIGAACPEKEVSLSKFKSQIDFMQQNGQLQTNQYIGLLSLKNFKSKDVIEFITQVSQTSGNSAELLAVLNFLHWNLDSEWQSTWFKSIIQNLFGVEEKSLIGLLNHMVYLLIEKDIVLVYELLTLRFEKLGRHYFLKDNWDQIISADHDLFQGQLVKWLNSDKRNVHSALLRLCSEIDADFFRLPKNELATLTSNDKLYIAIKIVGFIYSKDHLQSLIFSLMESVGKDEKQLMDNVFILFKDYVIYNYRTSLDTIKEILKRKQLPKHLLSFYKGLDELYKLYFAGLNSIEPFAELQPDLKLSQHIQFYTQNQFSEKYKESSKNSLASLFKTTPVHSHRWAFRRSGEEKHEVTPLGHFESSIEFPSGEKLNPIYQESMRRTYQKMKRDEININ